MGAHCYTNGNVTLSTWRAMECVSAHVNIVISYIICYDTLIADSDAVKCALGPLSLNRTILDLPSAVMADESPFKFHADSL